MEKVAIIGIEITSKILTSAKCLIKRPNKVKIKTSEILILLAKDLMTSPAIKIIVNAVIPIKKPSVSFIHLY